MIKNENENIYLEKENNSIVFNKVDAKIDIYSTDFEKHMKRLPSNLRFAKKYIYFELLPKIDKIIEELEIIKSTPNYDEKIKNIRPYALTKTFQITCFDLFETNNIKHMKSNKMIYGTINGAVIIYDVESQRIITEKIINNTIKSRVDVIASSTVRYFDTYLSRIAVHLRGDPSITIFSYNHSFSVMNQECVINLKEGLQTDPNINLSSLIHAIKFSKDTFYMTLSDYSGGVRVYKFNDIPQNSTTLPISQGNPMNVSQGNPMNVSQGTGLNFKPEGKKESVFQLNFANRNNDKRSTIADKNNLIDQNIQGATLAPVLILNIKNKEIENYTIINSIKEDVVPNTSQKKIVAINAEKNKLKEEKKSPNKNSSPVKSRESALNLIDENINNNNKVHFDENTNSDITPTLKLPKNLPSLTFIQKKLIFEEKLNGGFSSCLITVGIYISFYNTNNLKFVSLYPFLTDNMKNIFKVVKTKGGGHMSAEESISLNTSMAKKEKEYITFLKSKLDNAINNIPVNNNISSIATINSPVRQTSLKIKKIEEIKNTEVPVSSEFNEANFTRTEINFTTLFPITFLIGQKSFNNHSNLISLGMKDGSILVWDAELHIDKYFFQEERAEIISLSIDENYLMSGSLDGQIHIYDLIKGNLTYKCYHNPYMNNPIQTVY